MPLCSVRRGAYPPGRVLAFLALTWKIHCLSLSLLRTRHLRGVPLRLAPSLHSGLRAETSFFLGLECRVTRSPREWTLASAEGAYRSGVGLLSSCLLGMLGFVQDFVRLIKQ